MMCLPRPPLRRMVRHTSVSAWPPASLPRRILSVTAFTKYFPDATNEFFSLRGTERKNNFGEKMALPFLCPASVVPVEIGHSDAYTPFDEAGNIYLETGSKSSPPRCAPLRRHQATPSDAR